MTTQLSESRHFNFIGKIIHHHFNGIVKINKDDKNKYYLIFEIKDQPIIFHISKFENINTRDKKLYISKVEYSADFPQEYLQLFNTLGMLRIPTMFYLVYNLTFDVWYIKNNNLTTVFMVNKKY